MQTRHQNDEQYFEELARTTRRYILPFIQQHKSLETGMRVLEIGCGVGGNLQAFKELGCTIHGIDLVKPKVDLARRLLDETGQNTQVNLSCRNFLTMPAPDEAFDLVFVHDVIEHIADKDTFMERLKAFLRPDGMAYFAFPAWQMPFGGHQQMCRSRVISRLPFIHLLPASLYRTLLKGAGENLQTVDELLAIQRCKTSSESFRRLVRRHGYDIVREQLYLINPHYEAKFGLRPRKIPRWIASIPRVRDFFATSCFYLVQIR